MAKPGFREWIAAGAAIADGGLMRYDSRLKFTQKFETRFADMIGAKRALAVNNGTAALSTALAAAGIGPGDEVLVPAYTWMATPAAPVLAGAVPVLVDIDESLTIDPADIERKITPYTKAIIPVHMVNAPANMDAIMAIARRRGLLVIEDACQAVGVQYGDRYCGSIGHMGAFSFNRYKNMSIGEGGAVCTSEPRLYDRALNFHDLGVWARDLGTDATNEPVFVGGNLRVTEIQTAMLNVQLSKLKRSLANWKARRKAMAEEIERAGNLRISPHHSPDNAVTLTVIFDRESEAEAFAQQRGVTRVFDNSKHVYTNWRAIMEKRTAHPKFNPWAWANREISYTTDMCARTLDILRRTCRIGLGERWPVPVMRYAARRLAASGQRMPAAAATSEQVVGAAGRAA
jgi:dTDP-4-amino-4,6-dideoxygalactose transaminase